jgi:hypothetical protein
VIVETMRIGLTAVITPLRDDHPWDTQTAPVARHAPQQLVTPCANPALTRPRQRQIHDALWRDFSHAGRN